MGGFYLEQAINVLTWLFLIEERSGFYGLNSPWVTNILCTGIEGAKDFEIFL